MTTPTPRQAALERIIRFVDVWVRERLPNEHTNCAIDSGCSHGAFERENFERLEEEISLALAAIEQTAPEGGLRRKVVTDKDIVSVLKREHMSRVGLARQVAGLEFDLADARAAIREAAQIIIPQFQLYLALPTNTMQCTWCSERGNTHKPESPIGSWLALPAVSQAVKEEK